MYRHSFFLGLVLLGSANGSLHTTTFDDASQQVVDSPFILKYTKTTLPTNNNIRSSDDAIPFITLHGLGDACENSGMAQFTQELADGTGSYGKCVEFGAGTDSWFKPIPEQVEKACQVIKADPKLANGFNVVGLSQGNCVARGLIEQCLNSSQVHNYVSLGGPHMGVASIPQCESGVICKILNGFIGLGVYTKLAQDHVGPANYFKDPSDLKSYLSGNIWLPEVNNEDPSKLNPSYKKAMASLNSVTLVKFAADTVVDPKESEWFGFFKPGGKTTILAFNETDDYLNDTFGVKTLNEAGKLKFVTQPGQHLNIDKALVDNTIIPALKSSSAASRRIPSKIRASKLFLG
mmetsp:Transcript_963/g.1143  ORF Transcript_963/g.1143 Transcript_963/m.1143 type:complete len:348 (+) Transcript_963:259-1302(+)|eukprot:CAMPEP_0197847510 /NCGR_PEP_ID=MMETSP1438-20131217/6354_1 /TAXON_ID=1461541 /ORGANISM="Pterosperma sp., Strain CCMP1384" /LENGTH=347 /DNA_ID=CAMNT_0043459453 /DNA_START=257 /DNA_END=1300 /DNA_ORIENTATION=+